MKRFISFGSIQQYRNIVQSITMSASYMGQDEDDQPVYNHRIPAPKLQAIATEKIHGTNAAVCFTDGEFWIQSRKNIITELKDNAACALHVELNKPEWMNIINDLIALHNIDTSKKIVSVFFEWSGGSIQKNSAITGLSKRAFIFQHFKVSDLEAPDSEDGNADSAEWFATAGVQNVEAKIFNVMNFWTWTFDIDFANPKMSQNDMIKVVDQIEENSPIGHTMGKENNIGEGIVVTLCFQGKVHRFKVKGEKHSKSKVKTLQPVDEEKEQAKIDFANYACKSWRLEQAWQTVFGIDDEIKVPSIRDTGEYLKAVHADVIKEEKDIMVEQGLEPKDVNGMISKIARQWFMDELDKEIMGD